MAADSVQEAAWRALNTTVRAASVARRGDAAVGQGTPACYARTRRMMKTLDAGWFTGSPGGA